MATNIRLRALVGHFGVVVVVARLIVSRLVLSIVISRTRIFHSVVRHGVGLSISSGVIPGATISYRRRCGICGRHEIRSLSSNHLITFLFDRLV